MALSDEERRARKNERNRRYRQGASPEQQAERKAMAKKQHRAWMDRQREARIAAGEDVRAYRTKEEMAEIDQGLIDIVRAQRPLTVRAVSYQASTRGLVPKDELPFLGYPRLMWRAGK